MDCSIPGFPVHHQLVEPTQTPVHCVRDGIQPSHPLSSPSPPTFNLPASGSFPMSPFFASGGKSNGVSASEYSRLIPLGLTGWLSFQSKGFSRIFSNTTVQKHQFFSAQLFFIVQLSHPYMSTGKTKAWTRWTFVGKVMFLLSNMLSWS